MTRSLLLAGAGALGGEPTTVCGVPPGGRPLSSATERMFLPVLSPREQGSLGELSAMEWFGRHGWQVYFPVTHGPDADLVVTRGDDVRRVQVKTSRVLRKGRYDVMLCTRGGNRSWNGRTASFSPTRCDLLFVLVADGRRLCIPSRAVPGRTKIVLGGPTYASYEVERGTAFGERVDGPLRGHGDPPDPLPL